MHLSMGISPAGSIAGYYPRERMSSVSRWTDVEGFPGTLHNRARITRWGNNLQPYFGLISVNAVERPEISGLNTNVPTPARVTPAQNCATIP